MEDITLYDIQRWIDCCLVQARWHLWLTYSLVKSWNPLRRYRHKKGSVWQGLHHNVDRNGQGKLPWAKLWCWWSRSEADDHMEFRKSDNNNYRLQWCLWMLLLGYIREDALEFWQLTVLWIKEEATACNNRKSFEQWAHESLQIFALRHTSRRQFIHWNTVKHDWKFHVWKLC